MPRTSLVAPARTVVTAAQQTTETSPSAVAVREKGTAARPKPSLEVPSASTEWTAAKLVAAATARTPAWGAAVAVRVPTATEGIPLVPQASAVVMLVTTAIVGGTPAWEAAAAMRVMAIECTTAPGASAVGARVPATVGGTPAAQEPSAVETLSACSTRAS